MATDQLPAIIVCLGSFHTPKLYAPLVGALQEKGFQVSCPALPTTSISDVRPSNVPNPAFDAPPPSGGWPTGYSDVEVIREEIKKLLTDGKRVLLVAHSHGGWVASESAIPELQMRNRTTKGLSGGVVGILFISGFIAPVGQSADSLFAPNGDASPQPPFYTFHRYGRRGLATTIRTEEYFFHDLPAEEAKMWSDELRAQPLADSRLTYPAYLHVPCGYLFCKQDKVFPLELQQKMVNDSMSKGATFKTYLCDASHEAFLSVTREVVNSIKDFSKSL